MARVRWEYREVVRSVTIVAVEDVEAMPTPGVGRTWRAVARMPESMPRRHGAWVRWVGPALGIAALALSREVIERRHRLGVPKPAGLAAGRSVLRALPAGNRPEAAP